MNQCARLLVTTALWLLAALAHASTVTYVYTDPQGTPLAEADAEGNITARFDYTPYGQPVTSVGAAPNGPGYTGHVNDPDTGFVYMQQRYYDPLSGRFLSVDPVTAYDNSDIRFFNRYAYAFDNPYAFKDPDGRCPVCAVIAVRFVIGAGIDVATQHFDKGKDWGDVDLGDAAIAGVVSTALPGVGNLAKRGYQGVRAAAPAVRAIAKVATREANTLNRAAKNAATIARNVEKVEGAAADVGIAATAAGAHQVVKAAAQSSTPVVKASDVRDAVKPPPPPPPPDDKRLNH